MECAKSFRDAAGLQSHCSAKKHGNCWPSPARLGAQQRTVDMGTHTMVFVPASQHETGALGITKAGSSNNFENVLSQLPNVAPTSTFAPRKHSPRCSTCELSFQSKKELENHMKKSQVHPTCAKCKGGFVDKATLQLVRSLCRMWYRVSDVDGHAAYP